MNDTGTKLKSGSGSFPGYPHRQPVLRRRISSAELLGPAHELVIEHAGEEYRLRLTSQGKLILNK